MFNDIYETRRANARALSSTTGSNAAFARKIGREPTQVSRFIGKNPTVNIGDEMARHLEKCFNLEKGWLDQNHENLGIQHTPTLEAHHVPLLTTLQIERSEQGQETIICPFPHSANTFAFIVEGLQGQPSAMHPQYGKAYPVGSIVFVDKDLAATATHNDVVAAILTDSNAFTFRLLMIEAGKRILMPLNPQFPAITEARPFTIIGKIIGATLA